ncbi:MAG: DNA-protecting protein DprA [Firmicutes bacterium HGW-Firmicutes-5]|nr:MAG: DNA-protecting protein DprA [Firmicutes bacterium HGW-Firmicutes-5]
MEYWIWLSQLKGIGPVTQRKLLQYFGTPDRVFASSEEELRSIGGIGPILAQTIQKAHSLDGAFSILEELQQKEIKILIYDDLLYPDTAKAVPNTPVVLYYQGTLKENHEAVSIVGSRRCSGYGKQVAVEAAEYLAQQGTTVISGLAKGIDSYAHTGNGLDVTYPKEHRELQAEIVEKGAVISEYLPKTKARPEHFPRRNLLISSWSEKILVVEAAQKSGALITAQYAKMQGHEVLVPPHELYRLNGKGTNALLMAGATLYLSPSQLLGKYLVNDDLDKRESLGPIENGIKSVVVNRSLTEAELKIQAVLMDSGKTVVQIGTLTGIDQVDLIEHLSIMEIEGIIEFCAGGRFVLAG